MVTGAGANRGAKNRIHTGIALSATELCAAGVGPHAAGAWRAALEPPNGDAAWPSLATALSELARALGVGGTGGVLAVSLMPPLTEVRRLELPPLRDDELQRLLSRNASRYFVHARGPQVVGASWIGRQKRGEGGPAPLIAAAASARLIAVIRAAAEQSGWTVDSIAPAETAWSASARRLWPAFGREAAQVVVAQDDRTDVLHLDGGQLIGVRRFRGGAVDAAMIADTVRSFRRIGIAGAAPARRDLVTALEQAGVRVLLPAGDAAAIAGGDVLAAQFAGETEGSGPTLRSEDAATVDRVRATKLTWAISGVAAALLVLSAGVELWGVTHQLRVVREERAALRGQITATLVGRTTLESMYRQVAALNTIDRTAPQWSAVIASLSEAVPQDAHLTAIRTRQDSLVVDGLGEHAARVFDALASTPGLIEVRSAAPVRREAQDDGSALEHFTIAARVEPSSERAPSPSPVLSGHARRPGP
jgi:hypothetical protein